MSLDGGEPHLRCLLTHEAVGLFEIVSDEPVEYGFLDVFLQHADGLGESLEQHEVDEFEDSDTYYDDDGEICEEELHWKVYISFWQDKNFRIMTEEELKG